jgi:hypothetical protein
MGLFHECTMKIIMKNYLWPYRKKKRNNQSERKCPLAFTKKGQRPINFFFHQI